MAVSAKRSLRDIPFILAKPNRQSGYKIQVIAVPHILLCNAM